jgi:hypothetical protein
VFSGGLRERETIDVEIVRQAVGESGSSDGIDAFLRSGVTLEAECADALRRILCEQIGVPAPDEIAVVAQQFRARVDARNDDAMLVSALMAEQSLVHPESGEALSQVSDAFLLIAAVSSVLEPGLPDEEALDDVDYDPDELFSVSTLTSADWLQIIVNAAKRGAGSFCAADDLFDWIEDDLNPDELPAVEIATKWVDRMWHAIGVTGDDERLSVVGAWLLPRGACLAWGKNFDAT